MRGDLSLALGIALSVAGCIPSNVVAPEDRVVVEDASHEPTWTDDAVIHLEGLYESTRIEGDAALQLWKILYWFEPSGRYTAAALLQGDAGPTFQTLEGTFRVARGGLSIDGAPPVEVRTDAGGTHLRIASPEGTVILRRPELR